MRIITFMEESIYLLANKLHDSISSNDSVRRLNELEKELNDSFEVYTLSSKKDECLEKYTRLKESLGESHEDTLKALKELKVVKEKLSNFPLVAEYLKEYSKVRDLYNEVDNILFSEFRKVNKCR